MDEDSGSSIKVGLFVALGVACLVIAIYFIGSKQKLFSSTIKLSATFTDVGGLMRGNNVRFSGIDVGTVDDIVILDDSTVLVEMIIEKDVQKFIKKDAIATIGTNGLMGTKLVNITTSGESSDPVSDGGRIRSREPVQIDRMLQTLEGSNANLKDITTDIKQITSAINNGESPVGKLLKDTAMASRLDSVMANLQYTSKQAARTGDNLANITSRISSGKGALGKLIADTATERTITRSLSSFEQSANKAKEVTGNLAAASQQIEQGKGALGVLLNDSSAAQKVTGSLSNIEKGTYNFNENMKALQSNILFRRYFKKKKKAEEEQEERQEEKK